MLDTIITGDAREALATLPDESVHCCVTSPPYWGLRDYGCNGQIGLESTPEEFVDRLVKVFREVRRVLRKDGTLWLNLGDCYATGGKSMGQCPGGGDQGERFLRMGHVGTQPNRMPLPGLKPKDMVGIPWRTAFALQADGWTLRSDVIWSKPNPMPESVKDRPTKAHEYLFLLSKSPRYFYDADAVREAGDPASANSSRPPTTGAALRESQGGLTRTTPVGRTCGLHSSGRRNRRSVWTIATQPFPGAHFAVMPPALVRPCVLAGCPVGGIVIDPFMGAGTVGVVAVETGRRYLGIELNPEYVEMARERIRNAQPVLPGFEPGRAANA